MLKFEVLARRGRARAGILTTPHGRIETPAFMPVGTLGAVKGLTVEQLEATGAQVQLSNLYHLSLRPGIEAIEAVGGIHAFTGWTRPILTDSGGYQIFSLAHRRRIDDVGVIFRNHIDGGELRLTPEDVVERQHRIGVDIAMVLDECPPWPVTRDGAAKATARTFDWAQRSAQTWSNVAAQSSSGVFGIVQGGVFEDLRREAAESMSSLGFDGYAIGGVSVGEPKEDRRHVVETTTPHLPSDRPRYLMGVGTPEDIAHAVEQGVDLFDCVMPTRNARHGLLFTSEGQLKIKNARYRTDTSPVDPRCGCVVCRRSSRAFVHHLFRSGEVTGGVLATVHNLHFYLDFIRDLREAIASAAPVDPRSTTGI